MEQITVVIGDRPGKGQKVAAGVEKSGRSRGRRTGRRGRHEAGRCDESGKRHFRHFILRQRRRGRYHRAKQAWLQSQIWNAVSG